MKQLFSWRENTMLYFWMVVIMSISGGAYLAMETREITYQPYRCRRTETRLRNRRIEIDFDENEILTDN